MARRWMAIAALGLGLGCGDKAGDDSAAAAGGGEGCPGLCTGAGFSGGTETDYGGGVIECVCAGSGEGIAQDDCTAYCADFGVGADRSFVSGDVSPGDKCVCDGTGG
jgi:hypothetical protein